MKLLKRNHIFVSIETMSTNTNAMILSIGAVKFSFDSGIGESFSVNIDMNDSINFRHYSTDTVGWWRAKPKEIRDKWKSDPKSCLDACREFTEFFDNSDAMVWSKNNLFELTAIKSLYEDVGLDLPWKHWNTMDTRTVFSLLDLKLDYDVSHIALNDAISGAEHIIKVFKL